MTFGSKSPEQGVLGKAVICIFMLKNICRSFYQLYGAPLISASADIPAFGLFGKRQDKGNLFFWSYLIIFSAPYCSTFP